MPRTRTRTRRPLAVAALAAAAAVSFAGCTSDAQEEGPSPAEVLAGAKANLDDTSGVRVNIATEELPPGVSGIVSADGVGAHPPAFEGTLKVAADGITADVAVIAVDGKVYAELPFTTEFTEVDPAEYGAPDPAALMAPEGGLSSLLTATKDPEEGEPVRSGETVLTEYTGTVPGDVVASIIPSASAGDDFDVRFTITEDEILDEARLTGPFYPDADEVTYTISFDDYGAEPQITAP